MKKYLILAIAILSNLSIHSQNDSEKNTVFIRVYNLEGDKINKGNVLAVKDTILQLEGKNGMVDIDVRTIGLIKTKRSEGNNVLIGSLVGLTTLAILGATQGGSDEWFSSTDLAVGGGVVGAVIGAGTGAMTLPFKNSKSYIINGDTSKWKKFQEMIRDKYKLE
jgi:hypothetical protein